MGRPLLDITRVEIKIFNQDRETMIKHYGPGWTSMIRELVKNHCVMVRASGTVETMEQLTAGDFEDE